MKDDDLNRILSEEEELLPSSGFATCVMDAVRREASIPPPIPFPWKRALPGLAIAGLAVVAVLIGLAKLVRGAASTQFPPAQPTVLVPILHAMINARVGWITLVLLVTLASVLLSMRLTSRLS
ncbi:MAG TPA: hypothetical protein VIX19_06530 [Terriglobales bacterium]